MPMPRASHPGCCCGRPSHSSTESLNALDIDLIELVEHFDLVRLLSVGAVASTAVEPVFCPLITAETG